jgi:DNA invertase Pin-like site-specific DNA recombinase
MAKYKLDLPADVDAIRKMYAEGIHVDEIAAQFNIHRGYVERIAIGDRYGDMGTVPPVRRRHRPPRRTPENLTAAQARLWHAQGFTPTEIAERLNLAQPTVSDILQHKSFCPSSDRHRGKNGKHIVHYSELARESS